jgi:putative exporter of polyketide antibiotics
MKKIIKWIAICGLIVVADIVVFAITPRISELIWKLTGAPTIVVALLGYIGYTAYTKEDSE